MTSRSRTYLPTDWQLWVYTPVADVWRWDFSTWDGGDVWGDVDETGSLQVLDTKIASIELTDGITPDNSYLGNISGSQVTITGTLDVWNAGFIEELYVGKKIALTLKNEADLESVEFGSNTVYFVGRITSCFTTLNPQTNEVIYTITGEDYFAQALSQLMLYQRSIIDPKYVSLQFAIDEATTNGLFPDFMEISLWTASSNTNETATAYTDTLGVFLNDYVASEVALVLPTFVNTTVGSEVIWKRIVDIRPLFEVASGHVLTDDDLINIQMGIDGGDRPTSFKLNNATATVEFGANQAGYLANQNTYTNTIDTTIAGLNHVISTLQTTTQKLSPITVELQAAQTYKPIIYTYTGSDAYIYPDTHYAVGDEITIDSATLGTTYDAVVVAIKHTIDPDNWVTTIELSKGL